MSMTVNHDLESVLKENVSGYLTSFEYKKTRIAEKRGIATPATTGKRDKRVRECLPAVPSRKRTLVHFDAPVLQRMFFYESEKNVVKDQIQKLCLHITMTMQVQPSIQPTVD